MATSRSARIGVDLRTQTGQEVTGSAADDGGMTTTTQTILQTTIRAQARPASDPRTVFAKAVAVGGDVVAAVRPEQLGDATPCPDYDVRALLGHLVTVLN